MIRFDFKLIVIKWSFDTPLKNVDNRILLNWQTRDDEFRVGKFITQTDHTWNFILEWEFDK